LIPKREEEAIKNEMMMAAKFEIVEPHPLFCNKRYANKMPGKIVESSKIVFHQIESIDPENF
jgi:hypothetical protein